MARPREPKKATHVTLRAKKATLGPALHAFPIKASHSLLPSPHSTLARRLARPPRPLQSLNSHDSQHSSTVPILLTHTMSDDFDDELLALAGGDEEADIEEGEA